MEIFISGSNSDEIAHEMVNFIKSQNKKTNIRILEATEGAAVDDIVESMGEVNPDIVLINKAFNNETELRTATSALSKHKGKGTILYAVDFPMLQG